MEGAILSKRPGPKTIPDLENLVCYSTKYPLISCYAMTHFGNGITVGTKENAVVKLAPKWRISRTNQAELDLLSRR